jgi:hypothetical protein
MSHKRVDSATTILSILSCSSDTFSEFYEGPYVTNILVEDAKRIISRSQTLLQEASQDRYRLDELLLGMLDHAPDPSGQRYVAVVLHIANDERERCSGRGSQSMVGLSILPESVQTRRVYVIFTNYRSLSVGFIKDRRKRSPALAKLPTSMPRRCKSGEPLGRNKGVLELM